MDPGPEGHRYNLLRQLQFNRADEVFATNGGNPSS